MYAGQKVVVPPARAVGTYGSPVGHRGGYDGSPHPYSETEAV
jgi:hypothetical protein